MDEDKLKFLAQSFQRTFALPITKSTFRDIQNSIMTVTGGDPKRSQELLEKVVKGDIEADSKLKEIFAHYSYLILVAKDVYERGDFVGMVTSDTVTRDNQIFFSNRIRRIDGTELHFVSDVDSTIQLMNHLLNRLSELKKLENASEIFERVGDRLTFIEEGIKALKD